MNTEKQKWHTDNMPHGYPKNCDTDLLNIIIQDLNDEYVIKKKNGKISKIWEDIILQQIESGNEELRQRTQTSKSKFPWFSMNNPIVWLIASIILAILVAAIQFWANKDFGQIKMELC